jgi:hypothetical protein
MNEEAAMKCPVQAGGNAEILVDYCAHTLDGETVTLLELHMKDCPDCRAFRDAQSELWMKLESWKSVSVSPDFNRRLFSRIETEEEKPWWRQWRGIWTGFTLEPAMPFAATVLAAMAAFLFQATTTVPQAPDRPILHTETKFDAADIKQAASDLEDLDMLRALPALFPSEVDKPANSI